MKHRNKQLENVKDILEGSHDDDDDDDDYDDNL